MQLFSNFYVRGLLQSWPYASDNKDYSTRRKKRQSWLLEKDNHHCLMKLEDRLEKELKWSEPRKLQMSCLVPSGRCKSLRDTEYSKWTLESIFVCWQCGKTAISCLTMRATGTQSCFKPISAARCLGLRPNVCNGSNNRKSERQPMRTNKHPMGN